MSGTLSLVATPIGNLEDITHRALRVLREVRVIAAEDTRRTAKLLTHYGVSTPTLSFHEHNYRSRTPQLLARLAAGEDVALVTDAGTPGISDPGVELVQACIAAGIAVDPIPGPSAPLAAAVASGFPLHSLTILGFPPVRAKERSAWFAEASANLGTVVFFEAPHRIKRTLSDVSSYFGNRQICVARELTKTHQEFVRGRADETSNWALTTLGEFTVVIAPRAPDPDEVSKPDQASIAAEFKALDTTAPAGRRQRAAAVARKLGLSVNDVYKALEAAKHD